LYAGITSLLTVVVIASLRRFLSSSENVAGIFFSATVTNGFEPMMPFTWLGTFSATNFTTTRWSFSPARRTSSLCFNTVGIWCSRAM